LNVNVVADKVDCDWSIYWELSLNLNPMIGEQTFLFDFYWKPINSIDYIYLKWFNWQRIVLKF
jgi:hypothetical protein